jgi:hypothetical protein
MCLQTSDLTMKEVEMKDKTLPEPEVVQTKPETPSTSSIKVTGMINTIPLAHKVCYLKYLRIILETKLKILLLQTLQRR